MKDVSDIVGNYKKFKELKKEQSKAKKLQAQLELSKEISKNLDDDRREARRLANELPDIVLPEDGGRPQEDLIVDGSTLLQDVINGHYTMEDISVAQGGCKEDQDPVERSALQLFDNIVTYSKKRTQDILQSTDDPRQFFQSLQQSGIDIQNMRP